MQIISRFKNIRMSLGHTDALVLVFVFCFFPNYLRTRLWLFLLWVLAL